MLFKIYKIKYRLTGYLTIHKKSVVDCSLELTPLSNSNAYNRNQ